MGQFIETSGFEHPPVANDFTLEALHFPYERGSEWSFLSSRVACDQIKWILVSYAWWIAKTCCFIQRIQIFRLQFFFTISFSFSFLLGYITFLYTHTKKKHTKKLGANKELQLRKHETHFNCSPYKVTGIPKHVPQLHPFSFPHWGRLRLGFQGIFLVAFGALGQRFAAAPRGQDTWPGRWQRVFGKFLYLGRS